MACRAWWTHPGKIQQEITEGSPVEAEVGTREDSSRVDLGKERVDKAGVTVGGLGKVDDLIKGIDEVENRDSIKP